jgi:hypothetical protein
VSAYEPTLEISCDTWMLMGYPMDGPEPCFEKISLPLAEEDLEQGLWSENGIHEQLEAKGWEVAGLDIDPNHRCPKCVKAGVAADKVA